MLSDFLSVQNDEIFVPEVHSCKNPLTRAPWSLRLPMLPPFPPGGGGVGGGGRMVIGTEVNLTLTWANTLVCSVLLVIH